MWTVAISTVVKGAILGVLLFGCGFVIFALAFARRLGIRWDSGIDVSLIRTMTLQNPYFWLALAGSLMIGCALVASWPARPT